MRRIKRYLSFLLLILLITSCFIACDESISDTYEIFYNINEQIKDYDFETGKIKDNNITLYDSQNKEVCVVELGNNYEDVSLKYIHKQGTVIYYVIAGAVDDEQGIVFINDDTNQLFDGVKTLKRIGGNSYKYSTME